MCNGHEVFRVSNKTESCTQTPGFVKLDSGSYLVDMPGISDNKRSNEFLNVAAITNIFRKAKTFHIIFAIRAAQLDDRRGVPIFNSLARLCQIFTFDGCKNMASFLLPVICFPSDQMLVK